MSEYFDKEKFKKKLKKRINKQAKKVGKFEIKVGRKSTGFYFLGFVGSAVYYISTATDFWGGVLGFLKAIVWPAFLVFEALSKLGA